MTRTNVIIATAIAAVTISILAFLNQPQFAPLWPDRIQGFSFQPMRAHHDPTEGLLPSPEEIDADLALLEGKAHAVRTYSVEGSLADIPALADKHGLNVALGAWISKDLERNEKEVEKVIALANVHRNVVRVIVGNEVLEREELTADELAAYVDRVRSAVHVPVSTAETWDNWRQNPELSDHVDFIAAHILPYWEKEGMHVDSAVGFVVNVMEILNLTFPGKPIVITEVGWPSNGRAHGAAVPSPSNQATFLRRFLKVAGEKQYVYYIIEAFDQPWKTGEGSVGPYWGVWDAERQPKFSFHEPIVPNPHWWLLGGVSVLIAAIGFTLMVTPSHTLRRRGRSFLAVIAYAAATAAVWIVHSYMQQYLTLSGILVGIVLLIGMVGVIVVLLTEAHEWAEALWVTTRRRALAVVHVPDAELPKVSVHVPAYNEPPEMLIETLNALARLDYPDFEIVVIDNNTKDPGVWKPVEAHCAALGARFRFFHVDPLEGFKAGALNFALEHTDPAAAVVAVIDSDYQVSRNWLRDLVPQFRNERVSIVQAPQDYRDGADSAFKAMCYSEYAGFFYTGMCTRNERNAIIQHGTMTLVRRTVLQEAGGWAHWCITEDAELGLRIFELGHEALYIPRSYGRGLMPDTFLDYKKQRFRWAYGSVQILRRHAGKLLGREPSSLTLGQRYHFVAGWLPWFADGFNLIFNLAALLWSAAMVVTPKQVEPPLVVFSLLPLALFAFKNAKLVYIYKSRIGASTAQTLAGALAGLALAHTIARAMLHGLVRPTMPFFRTPKLADRQAWSHAIAVVWEEFVLMLGLWCAAGAVAFTNGTDSRDLLIWVIVLLVQSIPYAASVIASLVSSFPRLSARRIGVRWMDGEPQPESPGENAEREAA